MVENERESLFLFTDAPVGSVSPFFHYCCLGLTCGYLVLKKVNTVGSLTGENTGGGGLFREIEKEIHDTLCTDYRRKMQA